MVYNWWHGPQIDYYIIIFFLKCLPLLISATNQNETSFPVNWPVNHLHREQGVAFKGRSLMDYF